MTPMPQRQDPEPPLPDLRNLGNQKEVEKTRGGWQWWWVYPLIAALVFWWVGWGWGNTGGYWWGNRSLTPDSAANGSIENRALTTPPPSQSANSAAPVAPSAVVQTGPPPSGPGVKVLDAADKQPFIGKSFRADNVPVERKVNDRAMWIATSSHAPMLAVVAGGPKANPSGANVKPGTAVDATGTVEKAPSINQAMKRWDLSDQDAAQLEQEGAYIQVSQLTVPQR